MWHMSHFANCRLSTQCEAFRGEEAEVKNTRLRNLLALIYRIQGQIMSGSFLNKMKTCMIRD